MKYAETFYGHTALNNSCNEVRGLCIIKDSLEMKFTKKKRKKRRDDTRFQEVCLYASLALSWASVCLPYNWIGLLSGSVLFESGKILFSSFAKKTMFLQNR